VPPLRQRREDIPSLTALFLERATTQNRKRIQGLEPKVLELLINAEWPGNVRQLQNEVERAVVLARDGDVISLRHLSPELKSSTVESTSAAAALAAKGASVTSPSPASVKSASLVDEVAAFERKLIAEQPAFTNLLRRYLKPNEASVLADRIASGLRMELASKQALLETLNPAERLEKLLAYLTSTLSIGGYFESRATGR